MIKLVAFHITCMYMYVHVYRVGMLFDTFFQANRTIECSGVHDLYCSKFSLQDGNVCIQAKHPINISNAWYNPISRNLIMLMSKLSDMCISLMRSY